VPENVPDTGRAHDSLALPRLSVIVPVHNGGLHLSRCLEALRVSHYREFEVIVVDDCSTDGTPGIARRFGARCLRTPSTLGPAGARNLGVRNARGSIVVFVDADVVLPPNALELVADEFESDPELAAVFGSYDEAPAWESFLSQYKNLMHSYVHQNSNERAVTFWAGCGAIRKDVFERFGGFDASRYQRPSIEDIEFGYRLTQAGQKIRLNKRLQVKHLKRWTARSMLRSDIFFRAVPWTRLILETRNLPRDLNLTYKAQVSSALVGLLFLGAVVPVGRAAGGWLGLAARHPVLLEGALVAALLALNWHVYTFFARRRGWWFALRAVPLHWFYYLYSGIVFVICGSAQLARSLMPPRRVAVTGSGAAPGTRRTR
jgi:glycosyltransferase involved in cell wall biosynthesis